MRSVTVSNVVKPHVRLDIELTGMVWWTCGTGYVEMEVVFKSSSIPKPNWLRKLLTKYSKSSSNVIVTPASVTAHRQKSKILHAFESRLIIVFKHPRFFHPFK
jgi:hypothetical protein